jgi:hypothetical protein
VFLKGKDFHSIVIVIPPDVSKFYPAFKKLTAESSGTRPRQGREEQKLKIDFKVPLSSTLVHMVKRVILQARNADTTDSNRFRHRDDGTFRQESEGGRDVGPGRVIGDIRSRQRSRLIVRKQAESPEESPPLRSTFSNQFWADSEYCTRFRDDYPVL